MLPTRVISHKQSLPLLHKGQSSVIKNLVVCLVIVIILVQKFIIITPVLATISACSASASPNVVHNNSNATISFNVSNNDGANNINWVHINRPSSRYSITDGSSGGWSASVSSPDSVTFTGSSIAHGSSQSFSITVDTSPIATGNQNWSIDTSDDGGGSTTGCSGASTSISNDSTPPSISNVQTSNITDTTATVTWTTDESSSSSVDYGPSASYGSSANGNSNTTSHSVNLSGLALGTLYHFRVNSADPVGNNSQSGDDTFTTSGVASSTPTPSASPSPGSSSEPSSSGSSSGDSNSSSGDSSSGSSGNSGSITSNPADKIAPVVTVSSDFSKPFKVAPALAGTASDNIGVAKVEYSLDGGKNYLLATLKTNKVATQVTFTATFPKLEDGNYQLVVRATDQAGNHGLSKTNVLVIDQLPPLIGNGTLTVGPQTLLPGNGGLTSLAGISQKITLAAIGGATSVTLLASDSGKPKSSFSLVKNEDNGLWSADLNFPDAGLFQLLTEAKDGAGNLVTKSLGQLNILPNGQVTDGSKPVADAQLKVFYFDDSTQSFIPWDGGAFSQQNPQKVDQTGHYKLLLPPGKYYIQIQASGYITARSSIFNLTQFSPLVQDFKLEKTKTLGWNIFKLNLPDFSNQLVEIKLPLPVQANNNLVGQKLPEFSLTGSGQTLNSVLLDGKPTVVTILNSYLPQTTQQLNNLQQITQNGQFQSVVIFPMENDAVIQNFKTIGGYDLPIFADPEGKITQKFNLPFNMVNIFADRLGTIKAVKFGLLSSDELMKNLID